MFIPGIACLRVRHTLICLLILQTCKHTRIFYMETYTPTQVYVSGFVVMNVESEGGKGDTTKVHLRPRTLLKFQLRVVQRLVVVPIGFV